MHTVELLEEAVALAERVGYKLRHEWLAGGGGGCEVKGQKWIFLDLASDPLDQLDHVLEVLRHHPDAISLPMPQPLRELIAVRRVA